VILIDQIEKEKAQGRHPWDAVVEATAHRFRPILLTAAAAILGMIPIAPTIFWGPMAYAIMGGLAVATLLTLVFLPALYVTWFGIKRPYPDANRRVDLPQPAMTASHQQAGIDVSPGPTRISLKKIRRLAAIAFGWRGQFRMFRLRLGRTLLRRRRPHK
jgi:predicted RND superfamily exporter protein